jgi:hypothetical protein
MSLASPAPIARDPDATTRVVLLPKAAPLDGEPGGGPALLEVFVRADRVVLVNPRQLQALALDGLTPAWRAPYGFLDGWMPAARRADRLLLGGTAVHAIDLADGRETHASPPLTSTGKRDDGVYDLAVSGDRGVAMIGGHPHRTAVGLDLSDQQISVRWRLAFPSGDPYRIGLVAPSAAVFVHTEAGGYLSSCSLESGATLGRHVPPPAGRSRRLDVEFLASDARGLVLQPRTTSGTGIIEELALPALEPRWSLSGLRATCPAALTDAHVFLLVEDELERPRLIAVERAGGRVAWSVEVPPRRFALSRAQDTLYLVDIADDLILRCHDASTGAVRAVTTFEGPPTALADGHPGPPHVTPLPEAVIAVKGLTGGALVVRFA